jgi:hypothetical protein
VRKVTRLILALSVFAALSLSSAAAALGATYYVSTTGSDANPGTSEAPWATVQKALNTLQPGDEAVVRQGSYSQALVYNRPLAGWIAIRCEPSAVLTNPSGHTLRVNAAGAFLSVHGCAFRGSGVTSGGVIDLYGSNVELIGNEITGSNDNGIYTAEEADHVSILRNWIHDNGAPDSNQDHGIYLQGDDHLVANNVIHDHPFGFGIQHYDYGRRARVVGNTITHAGHGGIVVGGNGSGPEGTRVAGAVITNNIVAHNRTWGVDRDSTAPTSCSIHSNLAFANGSGSYDTGWPSGCLGSNLTGDPMFVDTALRNLRLRPGSPAIGAADAATALSPDFDGNARDADPDIGAFEAGGAPPPPPPPAPPPPPPPPACGQPSNLRLVNATSKNPTLSWDAVAGATAYRVYRDSAQQATVTGTSYAFTLAWGVRTLGVESVCGSQSSSRATLRLQATWVVS